MSDGELIRHAVTAAEIAQARVLFEEYAASIGVDLCFQNFSEELATLPGAYARPPGALLLAGTVLRPSGCVALRVVMQFDVRTVSFTPRLQPGGCSQAFG